MQILQNIICLEYSLNQYNRRIALNKDILRDKKITSVYLFSASPAVNSPITDIALSSSADVKAASPFLTLISDSGKTIVKDYSLSGEINTPESVVSLPQNIHDIIDLDKSFIGLNGTIAGTINLLLYITYESVDIRNVNDIVNTSVTKQIPLISATSDILLKDVFDYGVANQLIKKITVTDSGQNPFYLDLITKSGFRIENLPSSILAQDGDFELWFPGIQIDFDKSYLRFRNGAIDGNVFLNIIY